MRLKEVVLVSACRTAIGDFMGGLKDIMARDLAITAGKGALARSGIPSEFIDEICMGQLYTAMQGSLPARQVGLRVGLPHRSGAVNVNQNCTSGMRALEIASHNIMLDKTDIALVVGVESMTNAPYLIPKARMGYRMGQGTIEDHMLHDGLFDELVPGHMGVTAENVAEKYGITRTECDEHALLSHTRAIQAIDEGRFTREIVPVEIKTKKGIKIFDIDEHPIRNASMETMSQLPTVFKKDGVVTAANASGINDGASAAVIMSKDKAAEMGIKPLMKLINICGEGVDPKVMGLGPAVVIPKCLKQAGMKFDDVEYWELHEAFAAQWLGVDRMLNKDFGIKVSLDKVNHNGSGIALGHPVGTSGARLVLTCLKEMKRRSLKRGLVSACVGGGQGAALILER